MWRAESKLEQLYRSVEGSNDTCPICHDPLRLGGTVEERVAAERAVAVMEAEEKEAEREAVEKAVVGTEVEGMEEVETAAERAVEGKVAAEKEADENHV